MKPKLVILLGPTGVGKSDVAVWVATRVDGEIISADSLQVYRHMDIGAGKPPREVRERVPHHLMDLVDPDEEFNVARFREVALRTAQEIRLRGRGVIVCGGSGLYVKALTCGLFVGPGRNAKVREALEEERGRKGLAYLYDRLKQVDPDLALWVHAHDRHRIIRALEVYAATGKRMSQWQREHGFQQSPVEVLKIGLSREREELYDLINRRCEEMVSNGLIEEVKRLLDRGYGLELKPLQSIGYRHIGLYLKGEMKLEEAISLMKRDTRRLAKRQLTWFRADKEIQWFHPEKDREKVLSTVSDFL